MTVTDQAGNPIAGATVILVVTSENQLVEQTDTNGRFVFADIAPGQYLIACGQEGGNMVMGSIAVKAGEVSTLNCKL